MKLQDVIDQALSDPNFAQELKDKAMDALRAGKDTDDWEEFMAYFAEDAEQLASFRTLTGAGGCTATTACTMAVTSTAACNLTTTTLTTSVFCEGDEQSSQN
jgi:hypothetical protein